MSFTAVNLGFLPGGSSSGANGVSADGSIVYGSAVDSSTNQQAVYWDNAGIHVLPNLGGTGSNFALGASADGSIIVGESTDTDGNIHAVYWTGGPSWAIHALDFLAGGTGAGSAEYCSSDVTIIVGTSNSGADAFTQACVWMNFGAPTALPPLASNNVASGCSADGTVLVGTPGIWTGGPSWTLTALGLGTFASALGAACSSDGTIIVGNAVDGLGGTSAAYWNDPVSDPPNVLAGPIGGDGSSAGACDGTGTVIAGIAAAGGAAVWVAGEGALLPLFSGATATEVATGVSTDGTTIVGVGLDADSNPTAIKWTTAPTSNIVTVADLFFSPTPSFVDFTEQANRRKFIYVNGGAQDLQTDGSGPFAVTPPVFLSLESSNPPDTFAQNKGRGGVFVISGPDLTAGATNPPAVTLSIVSAADTVPFSAVLGDYLTGNIYTFDPDTLTDNGAPRKWVRRWRALPNDTTSAITFSYLALDMETGTEIPPGTNPQLVLRWSDDGGKTWSGNRIIPVGVTGATAFTVKANRLGSTSRFGGSTRIFELSSTDPFKVSIISAEVLTK